MSIVDQLEVIRNKGNCFQTLWKAQRALHEIKDLITEKEYWSICTVLSHVDIGEGTEELNDILKEIKPRYGKA